MVCPLGPAVILTARPPERLFHLVFESPWWKGLGAESEEKREPVSDIDTGVVVSLKVLDPDGRLEKRTRPGDLRTIGRCPRHFARRRHLLHHQIRQLRHHPQRRLAAGDALHVIVGVAQPRDLIVPGGAGEMRSQYYILECQQRIVWWRWLLVEHIEAGAKQLIVCERAGECGLVDHRAAA